MPVHKRIAIREFKEAALKALAQPGSEVGERQGRKPRPVGLPDLTSTDC
jgi:hypothetical protein